MHFSYDRCVETKDDRIKLPLYRYLELSSSSQISCSNSLGRRHARHCDIRSDAPPRRHPGAAGVPNDHVPIPNDRARPTLRQSKHKPGRVKSFPFPQSLGGALPSLRLPRLPWPEVVPVGKPLVHGSHTRSPIRNRWRSAELISIRTIFSYVTLDVA
jgi:hypothetical protein